MILDFSSIKGFYKIHTEDTFFIILDILSNNYYVQTFSITDNVSLVGLVSI